MNQVANFSDCKDVIFDPKTTDNEHIKFLHVAQACDIYYTVQKKGKVLMEEKYENLAGRLARLDAADKMLKQLEKKLKLMLSLAVKSNSSDIGKIERLWLDWRFQNIKKEVDELVESFPDIS